MSSVCMDGAGGSRSRGTVSVARGSSLPKQNPFQDCILILKDTGSSTTERSMLAGVSEFLG